MHGWYLGSSQQHSMAEAPVERRAGIGAAWRFDDTSAPATDTLEALSICYAATTTSFDRIGR